MSSAPRVCPLTHQPLPTHDVAAIISTTAQEEFRTDVTALSRLVQAAHALLPPGREGDKAGSRPQPASRPPLNLHALDILITAEHILELWAVDLLQNQYPGTHFVPGDWDTIQAIYREADLVHFEPAPDLIQEVQHQLKRLRVLTEKPEPVGRITELERLAKLDQLKQSWLTIDAACQAIRLYTCQPLAKSTVYYWIDKGELTAKGVPARVHFTDLLERQERAAS